MQSEFDFFRLLVNFVVLQTDDLDRRIEMLRFDCRRYMCEKRVCRRRATDAETSRRFDFPASRLDFAAVDRNLHYRRLAAVVADAVKENGFAVGRNLNLPVIALRVDRQLNGISAVRIHSPDAVRRISVRDEQNIFPVRRSDRLHIKTALPRQLLFVIPVLIDRKNIDLAVVHF